MSQPARQDRFLTLLDEHRGILFRVANSYGRIQADREDLAQEIVAQLWRSFDRYDDRYRFSTWMYRVALNVAISFHRGEVRRSRNTVPAEDALLEVTADAADSAAAAEDVRLLRQLIQQLEALDRALIILYLDGNPYATIAEVLGISETNVATKISRIKQRLRRDLVATA